MTDKEAIEVLTSNVVENPELMYEALDMAIKALEQQPCEDCISKESVIEWLKDKDIIKMNYQEENARRELAELTSVIPSYNSVKTELEQTRWIPISERLPEEGICDDGYVEPSDYVLVWGDHGNYGVSRYWGNRKTKTENPNSYKDWMDLEWVVQKPIAWMPLPEGYKEEEE